MEELVKLLIEKKKTISTMESCTGGYIVNAITNIPDASKVIKFSAITYANEFKIKMGVPESDIDEYTVYSERVAKDMALAIVDFTNSDYGVGITGKLKKADENNPYGKDDLVYLAIFDKEKNKIVSNVLKLTGNNREECKKEVMNLFIKEMKSIFK